MQMIVHGFFCQFFETSLPSPDKSEKNKDSYYLRPQM